MFEQLDKPKKVAQVSIAMSLGILAAYLIGAFGGACLFIVLGGRRFGIQVASAIVYTYFVFWYVFFPTRGLLEKYSLRDKAVQRQIPLLLAIHCVFLISIVFGQTVWLGMKLRQSNRWITEHGTRGLAGYAWVMIVVLFFIQVLISRRILSGSRREGLNKSGSVLDERHS